jgi:alpha-glucosidase
MSLSGMFNVGHDVGGFFGPSPTPELLVRWVQACSLNPRMVMNSWKPDSAVNVPWLHPEVTQHVVAAIRLRYALMPYIWSLFERASANHEPIIRPMFYDFPDDANCYADCDDFMLGRELLIAPVLSAGTNTRNVYLPNGPTAWFDFHTGQRYEAGEMHTIAAPLSTLPIFARSGAEIPVSAPVGLRARHDDPVSKVSRFKD